MVARVHGSARVTDTTFEGDEYEVFCRADGVDDCSAMITGNMRDTEQINFEILVQCMSLRTQVILVSAPVKMKKNDIIPWDHCTWVIKPVSSGAWYDYATNDSAGVLKSDLTGVVLHSRTVLKTYGDTPNIYIKRIGK